MVSKDFEQTIRFYEGKNDKGNIVRLPIVQATLITPGIGIGFFILPLLFDTGASVTTFRSEFFPLLGLKSWNQGTPVPTGTGGGVATAYAYRADLEIFGKTINTPIHLLSTLPKHPFFCGLLGRDTIFEQFGFGFWESSHELHVTGNP